MYRQILLATIPCIRIRRRSSSSKKEQIRGILRGVPSLLSQDRSGRRYLAKLRPYLGLYPYGAVHNNSATIREAQAAWHSKGSIGKLHNVAVFVWSSTLRREAFLRVVVGDNSDGKLEPHLAHIFGSHLPDVASPNFCLI